jgi:hypothetical protein
MVIRAQEANGGSHLRAVDPCWLYGNGIITDAVDRA